MNTPSYSRDVGSFDCEYWRLLDGLFVDQDCLGEEPGRFDGVGKMASQFPRRHLRYVDVSWLWLM